MSTKYIYYQAAQTPKFDDIVRTENANRNLRNGINNSKTTPKAKLSNITAEYDKPFMGARKSLLQKLNEYELANAGKYDDPEVNANIQDMKRQILDFGKFTTQEASTYEFLEEAVKNPVDEDGNLVYSINDMARVPKMIKADDVLVANSNLKEGQDYFYLFGDSSPMKDENTGEYIIDDEGFLLDENGSRIIGHNQDGSIMETDEFEFRRRRNFANSVESNLFSFGKNEIEYNGVPVSLVPEFNFDESEIVKAPKPQDYLGGVTNAVKIQSGGYDAESGNINSKGEKDARSTIRDLITVKTDGTYPNKYTQGALNEIALLYLDEVNGNSDPTDSAVLDVINNPDAPGYSGKTFADYAEDKLYEKWSTGKGYRPSKGMNINISGGGKSKDFFFGNEVNDNVRDLSNYTIVGQDGAAVPVVSQAYSEANLNNVKTLQTFAIREGVIFPQSIAGLDKIQDRTFRVVTDNVRIQAIDKSTGQVASKQQIESKDPNVEFTPYALTKATSNTPMSTTEYLKVLNDIPSEQQDSFKRLQDLLTKQDKTTEILVPLNQMFTSRELEQFKDLQDLADKMNNEYQISNTESSEEDVDEKRNNMRNRYGY